MSNSQMPDGGYDPQLGSNYMMDGFDFDSEYGDGVDKARKDPDPDLPRSQAGLAALPDGFLGTETPTDGFDFRMLQANDEDGLNIAGMVREAATPLNDLSWLESAEQDPDRLPEKVNEIEYAMNDFHQVVVRDVPDSGTRPELSQAWGVNRRTDGQNLVPNVTYPRPVKGPTSEIGGDQFRVIVAHAMRKSAFGEDFDTIVSEVVSLLGPGYAKCAGVGKFQAAMRAVRAEHGLVGNVYVRDSAFPKILSGKWDAKIKSRCASARFFLTTPGSKLAAYERYLGKEVVTEIPWDRAMDLYRPTLEAQLGKRLASGDARTVLRAAFLSRAEVRQKKATNFPTHKPVERVSFEEAKKAFSGAAEASPAAIKLADPNAELRKTADARIDRWVRAGLLSADRVREMRAKIRDPRDLYRTAAAEVATARSRVYSGAVFKPNAVTKTASGANPQEVRGLLRWASKQMSEGAAGRELDSLLSARFSGDLLKEASEPLVQLRKKHEGLAGHLYVEASAYASSSGTEGCEKGALLHRANAIRAVLGMDRCASCVANTEGTCQKYNKVIVASAPTKDPSKYQAEMIRLANADDSEKTASLFSPAYDAGEYGLRNDVLDDITYDHTPPPEDLGNVLFDGWALENDEE